MAYQKIQPKQIQLPTFYSRSGDLVFTDQTTGVIVDLNRVLTGDFKITGSLLINDGATISSNSTNIFNPISGNLIFGGLNNRATVGRYNTILAGSGNNISGQYNVIVNGANNRINNSSSWNTILAGSGCSFGNNVTGSVILADLRSATVNNNSNSLIINFASGTTFAGGPTTFETNFVVSNTKSGVFNSDIIAEATSYFNNVQINNNLSLSGDLIVDGQLRLTGDLSITGGSVFINSNIKQSGNLEVNGNIIATGLISGNNIASQIANINTINAYNLNISNSGILTGSPIVTESWIEQQDYLTIGEEINSLTIDSELDVIGTGTFGSVNCDNIQAISGDFNNLSTYELTASSGVFFNTGLKIGTDGTVINKLNAGGIVCNQSGNSSSILYTGSISQSIPSSNLFFCLSGIGPSDSRYLHSQCLNGYISVKVFSSTPPSKITGYYLLIN